MAANVLPYYNRNPYHTGPERQHLAIFSANGYDQGLLGQALSPIALRVLLLLASQLTPEGYARMSLEELAKIIHSPRSYVNKGILELAKYSLIHKKKQSEYWLNPRLFRAAVLDISQ